MSAAVEFTDLPAVTTLDDTDIMPAVHLPDGTGGSKKITLANLRTVIISTAIVIGAASLTHTDRLVAVGATTGVVKESKVVDGVTTAKLLTLAAADNYTLTVPATMTAAGRDVSNTFTAAQIIDLGTGALPTALTNTLMTFAAADATAGRATFWGFGATAFNFAGRYIGGTRAANSATTSAGVMCRLSAYGYDTALTTTASGTIDIKAGSLWASGNRETIITISGTSLNSTTLTQWSQWQNACLAIGTATPTAGNGLLQLDSGTTVANGIAWGTDTFAYRTAAGALAHLGVGGVQFLQAATQDGIIVLGRAGGTSSFNVTLTTAAQTASWNLTIPALTANDTIATRGLANTFIAQQNIAFAATNGLLLSLTDSAAQGANAGAELLLTWSDGVNGILSGNRLGQITFRARDSSAGLTRNANINVRATENYTTTNKGNQLIIVVTPVGTNAAANGVWVQSTTVTDPAATLGLGAAPTAGNGLLQLSSGTTKINGMAYGTDCFQYRSAAGQVTQLGTGGFLVQQAATQDGIVILGRAGGTSSFNVTLTPATMTASWNLTIPALTANDTLPTLGLAQTFTAANIIDAASGHPLILKANGTTFFSFLATAQVTSGATYASPTGTFRVFQVTPIISGSMTSAFVSNTFWATTTTDFSNTNTVLAVEFAARIGSAAGSGGGVVATAIGMQGVAQVGAAGVTITTGIAGNFSTTKGSGTIGTAIGVRIQACTGTTVIPLQIATSGGTAANFIGDQTGFGAVATNGNGLVQLGSGTTIAFGIAWGTDCFMYRTGTTAITLDAATAVTFTGNGIFNGITTATSCVQLTATATLAASPADAYLAGASFAPTYNGAFTVTRHNYLQILQPAGSSTITDACVFRFDAAPGTHKAVDSGTTKTSPGTVSAWIKHNINGTIYYEPLYTSKTS